MKCPIDNTELQMTERQNIEIDYCPTCRGVWLDRGELDKIIDRVQETSTKVNEDAPVDSSSRAQQSYSQQPYYGKHGKRKSLIGELFDF
jgi:Zn-finger nucleic acid-binding protein